MQKLSDLMEQGYNAIGKQCQRAYFTFEHYLQQKEWENKGVTTGEPVECCGWGAVRYGGGYWNDLDAKENEGLTILDLTGCDVFTVFKAPDWVRLYVPPSMPHSIFNMITYMNDDGKTIPEIVTVLREHGL